MKAIYAYRPLNRGTYPVGIEKRAPSTLTAWLRRFPASEPADVDPEDWIENACLLQAAEKAGLDLTILDPAGAVHISGAGWGAPKAMPGAPVGVMLGYWANADLVGPMPIAIDVVGTDARSVKIASGYASSATFRRHAGRPLALAGGDVEGAGGLEAAFRSITTAVGSGDLFIKTVRKEWSQNFQVDPESPVSLWRQIVDADQALEDATNGREGHGLSWIPVQYEGSRYPVLLIQGRIKPTFEYRIVIVDGRPVTGSGCIQAFTPAENKAVFDPQMEEVRSDGQVVDRPDLVERYLAFAEVFTREFASEHGEGLDYGLDVCIDAATGEVVVIELNPSLNLGAYARNTDAWLDALTERAERVASTR